MKRFKISDVLGYGAENAKTRGELCLLFGINDTALRKQINAERKNGSPILSSSHKRGYNLPDNRDEHKAHTEIICFVRECRSRARDLLNIAASIECETGVFDEGAYISAKEVYNNEDI